MDEPNLGASEVCRLMIEKDRFEENNPKGGEAFELWKAHWKQRLDLAVRREIAKIDEPKMPLEEAKAFLATKGMHFK